MAWCRSLILLSLAMEIAGCGGGRVAREVASDGKLPSGVVVRVGRHSLTKAALDRWTAIEAVLTYMSPSTQAKPKGLPDPPDYAGCVVYAKAATEAEHAQATPTRGQLKSACKQKYEAVQRHILDILITDYWVSEEAASKRLKVSAKEVQRALQRQFPSQAKFREYLSITGERPADQRALIKHQLLLKKMQWRVSPLRGHTVTGPESEQMINAVDLSLARLGEEMRRRWTPRTDCRVGYVVSECSQFGSR